MKILSKSIGAVKLPHLCKVPEGEFSTGAKTKMVYQIFQQKTNNTTNYPEQTTPTFSPQVNTTTYHYTNIIQEGQQTPQKGILIPFEQALQVRGVDQVKAHLKLSVDKFQGGCIKAVGPVAGVPINIRSNLPLINKYQYSFNDKEDAFIESGI